MPFGLGNYTNITPQNLTDLVNSSNPGAIFVNVNQQIYGGWLFFCLLLTLWVILFIGAMRSRDTKTSTDFIVFLLYSGSIVSIASFFLRAFEVVQNGIPIGLLTDFQMWIFPILTLIIGFLAILSKRI